MGPNSVKATPFRVAELTVTGEEPVEDRITVCVAGVFNATFPNPMLAALMLSAGPDTFSCKEKDSETLPAPASIFASCAVATAETVAEKVALVAPAATITDAGTVTAGSLLDRLTLKPVVGAAAFSLTVQVSEPEPVMDAMEHESAVNTAVPVPLSAMVWETLAEESLVMVN